MNKKLRKRKKHYSGWPVYQIDIETQGIIKTWRSAREADESFTNGKNNCCVAKACRGNLLTAYGFEWRYVYQKHLDNFKSVEKKRRIEK